jgi:hypothetical protein
MGLSMTPKWHMLLNHAIEFLIRTGGGLIEMGKDQIERAHQLRERERPAAIQSFVEHLKDEGII